MKILNLYFVSLFILILSACSSTQQVSSQVDQNKAELEKTYQEEEHKLKMEQLKAEYALKRKQLELQEKKVLQPCKEDSYDGEEYMAALGSANGKPNEHIATSTALKSAKSMIMNRFVGAFKTGLKEYTNTTTGASGNNRDLAKLEGGVMSAGESAINKYVSITCQEVLKNDLGGFDAYVAIHVSTKEVKKEIASKLEAMEVDYNAEKLFNYIDKEVEARKKAQEKIQ
ncbi:hypothetical protein [Marinifilum fragile]|uniref:hypothetical protein n=1 Tax=Marinifilum fragile TaxID=570161 RepID=UPI002AA78C38|nr:hypothetical protein [Marinifilum fragile]